MARLLLDEHVPVRLEHALKALGHDLIRSRSLSTDKAGDGIDDDLLLEQAAIHRHFAQSSAEG